MSFPLIYHPGCICSEETRLQRKQTPLTCLRQQSSNLITKDPLLHSHLDSEGDSLWTRVATTMWQRQCSRWSSRSEDRSPEKTINSCRLLRRNGFLQSDRLLCALWLPTPSQVGCSSSEWIMWGSSTSVGHSRLSANFRPVCLWSFLETISPRQTGCLLMMMVVKKVKKITMKKKKKSKTTTMLIL